MRPTSETGVNENYTIMQVQNSNNNNINSVRHFAS